MSLHVEMSAKLSSKANVSGIGFHKDKVLARNVKMYLYQRYSGKKIKKIGLHFGIGESGVSQACRRVAQKIEKGNKLKKKIAGLEKQINLSRMKT
jgi:chromosomal replication initiation ATPase DnaA